MIQYVHSEREATNIKISDALLYAVHKNNNRLTMPELLQYMKMLQQYNMIEINKDKISVSLTGVGQDRLKQIKLIR